MSKDAIGKFKEIYQNILKLNDFTALAEIYDAEVIYKNPGVHIEGLAYL